MFVDGFIATIYSGDSRVKEVAHKQSKRENVYKVYPPMGKDFRIYLKNDTSHDVLVNITIIGKPVLLNNADIFIPANTKTTINGYENDTNFNVKPFFNWDELADEGHYCEADYINGTIPNPEIIIRVYKAKKTYRNGFVWIHQVDPVYKYDQDRWEWPTHKDVPYYHPRIFCSNTVRDFKSNLSYNDSSVSMQRTVTTTELEEPIIVPSTGQKNPDEYYSVNDIERSERLCKMQFIISYDPKINPIDNKKVVEKASVNTEKKVAYCHSCGNEVSIDWSFCPNCGEKILK